MLVVDPLKVGPGIRYEAAANGRRRFPRRTAGPKDKPIAQGFANRRRTVTRSGGICLVDVATTISGAIQPRATICSTPASFGAADSFFAGADSVISRSISPNGTTFSNWTTSNLLSTRGKARSARSSIARLTTQPPESASVMLSAERPPAPMNALFAWKRRGGDPRALVRLHESAQADARLVDHDRIAPPPYVRCSAPLSARSPSSRRAVSVVTSNVFASVAMRTLPSRRNSARICACRSGGAIRALGARGHATSASSSRPESPAMSRHVKRSRRNRAWRTAPA